QVVSVSGQTYIAPNLALPRPVAFTLISETRYMTEQHRTAANDFRPLADFIWEIADLLRGDYKQADYGKVILPMTVLRRLDCVLEPTKDAVLARAAEYANESPEVRDRMLRRTAG